MFRHDLLQAAVVVCHVDDVLHVAHLPLLSAAFHMAGVPYLDAFHVTRTTVLQHVFLSWNIKYLTKIPNFAF